jgi:hypothetical protein
MAEFKVDLSPKSNVMTLGDLIKMNEYVGSRPRVSKPEPKTPASIIDKSNRPNDMLKSSDDDVGTIFRFNNNQKE